MAERRVGFTLPNLYPTSCRNQGSSRRSKLLAGLLVRAALSKESAKMGHLAKGEGKSTHVYPNVCVVTGTPEGCHSRRWDQYPHIPPGKVPFPEAVFLPCLPAFSLLCYCSFPKWTVSLCWWLHSSKSFSRVLTSHGARSILIFHHHDCPRPISSKGIKNANLIF